MLPTIHVFCKHYLSASLKQIQCKYSKIYTIPHLFCFSLCSSIWFCIIWSCFSCNSFCFCSSASWCSRCFCCSSVNCCWSCSSFARCSLISLSCVACFSSSSFLRSSKWSVGLLDLPKWFRERRKFVVEVRKIIVFLFLSVWFKN